MSLILCKRCFQKELECALNSYRSVQNVTWKPGPFRQNALQLRNLGLWLSRCRKWVLISRSYGSRWH